MSNIDDQLRLKQNDWMDACKEIDKLREDLRIAVEALEFYSQHESVIKEAYHSNDEKQITCVHTFINHTAVEALEKIRGK